MSRSLKRFVSRRFATLQEEINDLLRVNAAMAARLDQIEKKLLPLPQPPLTPAPAPETVEYELDTMSADSVQDWMPTIVRDVQAQGKLPVFLFTQDYRRGLASPNDLDVPEGTRRLFCNKGVAEMFIYMCGIGDVLLTLQPGETGALIFSNGAWVAEKK